MVALGLSTGHSPTISRLDKNGRSEGQPWRASNAEPITGYSKKTELDQGFSIAPISVMSPPVPHRIKKGATLGATETSLFIIMINLIML